MTSFSRNLLAQVTPDVRKHVPGVCLMEAWIHCLDRRTQWEFHYGDFQWTGRAGDAYEARYNGWCAYLASLGVEGYAREVRRN
ncbi:MAG TPA: hypothetical protein VJT32_08020 [bacterium]|nr:hypothetical protein [bacterium]